MTLDIFLRKNSYSHQAKLLGVQNCMNLGHLPANATEPNFDMLRFDPMGPLITVDQFF